MKDDSAIKLKQRSKNQKPSYKNKIEGVGSIEVFGVLDVEKLIKRLLECDEITG